MEDGLKLCEFVNGSFSKIKLALEKQSMDKRRVNSRKYIEKNRKKTIRKVSKTVTSKQEATVNKSQSRRLQQNRSLPELTYEDQCLPPWPAFDNLEYSDLDFDVSESSDIYPVHQTSFGPYLGNKKLNPLTQSTMNLDQLIDQLEPPVSAPTSVECLLDYGMPMSPSGYGSPARSSNSVDENELEDLFIDQLQASPASYSLSPHNSCVSSPYRRNSQVMPTILHPAYDDCF